MSVKILKKYIEICAALRIEPTTEGLKRIASIIE
jgi:hypothetical protein